MRKINALGSGIRPIVIGTVYMDDAVTQRAARWVYNPGLSIYEVSILPGASSGLISKALDMSKSYIVGEIDGHPAYWPIDNPAAYTVHSTVTGGFVAVGAFLGSMIALEYGRCRCRGTKCPTGDTQRS